MSILPTHSTEHFSGSLCTSSHNATECLVVIAVVIVVSVLYSCANSILVGYLYHNRCHINSYRVHYLKLAVHVCVHCIVMVFVTYVGTDIVRHNCVGLHHTPL